MTKCNWISPKYMYLVNYKTFNFRPIYGTLGTRGWLVFGNAFCIYSVYIHRSISFFIYDHTYLDYSTCRNNKLQVRNYFFSHYTLKLRIYFSINVHRVHISHIRLAIDGSSSAPK